MSHLSRIKRSIKCQECLVKALKDMGFDPIVSETPVSIRDMFGRLTAKAHIYVPGEQLNTASDLGFLFSQSEGEYVMTGDFWELNKKVPAELKKANPAVGFHSWFSAHYAVASLSISQGKTFEMGEFRVCPGEGEIKFTLTEKKHVAVSM